jgi:hypothetical protein
LQQNQAEEITTIVKLTKMKRVVKAHDRISELTLQPINHHILKLKESIRIQVEGYTFALVLEERCGIKSIKKCS